MPTPGGGLPELEEFIARNEREGGTFSTRGGKIAVIFPTTPRTERNIAFDRSNLPAFHTVVTALYGELGLDVTDKYCVMVTKRGTLRDSLTELLGQLEGVLDGTSTDVRFKMKPFTLAEQRARDKAHYKQEIARQKKIPELREEEEDPAKLDGAQGE